MRKTKEPVIDESEKKAVSTAALQTLLGCGEKTACDIGTAAGARMKIGRRVLWNVAKIQEYLDTISGS